MNGLKKIEYRSFNFCDDKKFSFLSVYYYNAN